MSHFQVISKVEGFFFCISVTGFLYVTDFLIKVFNEFVAKAEEEVINGEKSIPGIRIILRCCRCYAVTWHSRIEILKCIPSKTDVGIQNEH